MTDCDSNLFPRHIDNLNQLRDTIEGLGFLVDTMSEEERVTYLLRSLHDVLNSRFQTVYSHAYQHWMISRNGFEGSCEPPWSTFSPTIVQH